MSVIVYYPCCKVESSSEWTAVVMIIDVMTLKEFLNFFACKYRVIVP